MGGGNCLKYLKRGGTEKRGEDTKILKRGETSWVKGWVCQHPPESPHFIWLVLGYVLLLSISHQHQPNYD